MKIALAVLFVAAISPALSKGVPGGLKEVDIDDPNILELHEFVTNQLKNSDGNYKKTLIKLLSAKTQVVSGKLTTLIYKTESGKCSVTIWDQPWKHHREITKSTCGHDIQKKSTLKKNYKKEHNVMDMFNEFMLKHDKQYKAKEYKKRYHIFKANLKKIKMIQDNEQGTAKYGVTQFADLSEKEFKRYLGLKHPKQPKDLPLAVIPDIQLPEEYDWRHYNVVTPVKNQRMCGSCWAFSVTGNIEGLWAIQKGELLSLSEQELVDCDTSDSGCNGGYMPTTYDSIVELGGLETEAEYPYDAKDEKCHLDKSEIQVQISGGVNITKDEVAMAKWLTKNGPISIALNANAMQFYIGGVSHPFKVFCNPGELDHGVLIVGYGVHTSSILKKTLPYWIVKNSWGKGWGELGYYRVYRGDGTCGVNQMASSAVL